MIRMYGCSEQPLHVTASPKVGLAAKSAIQSMLTESGTEPFKDWQTLPQDLQSIYALAECVRATCLATKRSPLSAS